MEWQRLQGLEFAPAPDPLWRNAPAPLVARYNVLGAPLEFATNAPTLAALAEETFGGWGTPDAQAGEVLHLRVYLHNAPEAPSAQTALPLLIRAQGPYFWITLGSSLGFADRAAGFAAAFVTPAVAANRYLAQTGFLECLGIYLASRARPATLHAAALAHHDRCVLLTGGSGAGKSTLAYACLRAGFGLLAEDIVFSTGEGTPLLVWGNPCHLHLLPNAVRFFPELANAERIRQLNGETKLRIAVNAVRPGAAITRMPVWGVCSLSRASCAAPRFLPADAAQIRTALTDFKGDPPLDRAAMTAAVDTLLAGRIAHLEVGADLEAAVAVLRNWIETG
ncbi:MAG TPA: hypothetical protein VFB38_21605 [Chthonomonadaceae bacterium]|nr:hypothetical protein [Chthonomonadaceae bacterium]